MRSIEIEARTVDEAVGIACKELGVSLAQVNFEVVQEPTRGLLGIMGGKPAKVRVTAKETKVYPACVGAIGGHAQKAQSLLKGMLDRMNIPAQVEVEETEEAILLNIQSSYSGGLLIGYRGKTINSIQYLLNQMMGKDKTNTRSIEVEFQDYRKRRQQLITRLTKEAVKRVKESRAPFHMEPMGALDRKFVHLFLRDDSEVIATSIGDGSERHIVITLATVDSSQ
ncbi:MAG: RNA-binding cell elongation regulator Jag/EloR [bacterium]|nr:RNA-binding cell elongation regulator Jag/EloR [bacterium]